MAVAVGSGPALAATVDVTVRVINSNDAGTVEYDPAPARGWYRD